MENYWLVFDGKIYSEEQLRIAGWTDETLRAPYACRVRERIGELERVVITDHRGGYVSSVMTEKVKPVTNFKPTHFHKGPYGGHCIVKDINNDDMCIATFRDGRSIYASVNDIKPINNERDELIDDIEALCLSIETRQNQLSKLVKKLKGYIIMQKGILSVTYKPDGAWLNINPVKGAKCSLNLLQLSSKFNGVVRKSLVDLCQEPDQTETDLTTLDKPFGELDRATQLKLVEHVLDGGGVERCDPQVITGLWEYQEGPHKSKLLCFVDHLKYRAIQS